MSVINSMLGLLNGALRIFFDFLLYPFRTIPPIFGLLFVSLLCAIGMLLVFKATSNQARLAQVKRQIHACIFEVRLFNDDLRAILRAQAEMLRHNLTYLRLSLVPMFWMIIPLVFIIAQLQFHYGYSGLHTGQAALVKVQLRENPDNHSGDPGMEQWAKPPVELHVPEGLRIETPPVWIPSEQEVAWRIAADRPGDYEIEIRLGKESESKAVRVSGDVIRRSPVRVASSFWQQLIYPAEPALPATSPLKEIRLTYPERNVEILGWGLHWLVWFFILSLALAFALKKPFGVTI